MNPVEADFQVKILIKRHLMGLGGGRGQSYILTLQRSFIYKSKAKDEVDPKKQVLEIS